MLSRRMLLEDIKTFFKFVIIKVIILGKEVMHVEQIRISHIFHQLCSYAFRRIFDILLPEFLYELQKHCKSSVRCIFSMELTGDKIRHIYHWNSRDTLPLPFCTICA